MAKKAVDKTKGDKVGDDLEHWSDQPEEHDYPAAAAYLSLILPPPDVRRVVTALKAAPTVHYFAKDLLRASSLDLLPIDNAHVVTDLAKVKKGTKLSPVLLVRGDLAHKVPLTVADGYHRICASYHLNENAAIPCHLVDLRPSSTRSSRSSSRSAAPVQ
jgi:hypothetical protein